MLIIIVDQIVINVGFFQLPLDDNFILSLNGGPIPMYNLNIALFFLFDDIQFLVRDLTTGYK